MAKMKFNYNSTNDLIPIGIKLCEYRMNKKITKKNLSKEYNLNAHLVNKIEKGEPVASDKFLLYLKALGLDKNNFIINL